MPGNAADSGRGEAAALSAQQAATRLGVNERTIRRAIGRGELPAAKLGGVFRIAPADLERFRIRREGGRSSPPIPTPENGPLNLVALPTSITRFIGRERELAALATELCRDDARLVTLTGPGGVGKTRLAVQAAAAVAGNFPDGVLFVDLAPIADPALVAPAVAQVLGVREAGGESLTNLLSASLRHRRLLLVLDNFEHVLAFAPVVAELIAACPRITALITSRVRLRLSGEQEWAVPPLEQASGEALASTEAIAAAEAVQLFVDRARSARPDFALTAANAHAVGEICRRLDGLPLAIELAAARVKLMPPAEMLSHLVGPEGARLPLLIGGPRDQPARLRTLRDAIAWSYDSLRPAEQALFRRLSAFVGGFTLAAAEAVAETADLPRRSRSPSIRAPQAAMLDLLAELVDHSLVRAEATADGVARFGMLETIRAFGRERLSEGGEEIAARHQHAGWCLALAGQLGPNAKGADATASLSELEREHANLRAALAWLAERGDGRRLVRLAGDLWSFWQEHGHFAEGRHWLELALDHGHNATAQDRLHAMTGAGALAWYLADLGRAKYWFEQALQLAQQSGDRSAEVMALGGLAGQAIESGDYDRALDYHETALGVARAGELSEQVVVVLHNLAHVAWLRGEKEAVKSRLDEALLLAREHGVSWIMPSILIGLGTDAADHADYNRAAARFRESLDLGGTRGNPGDIIDALEGQARVAAAVGNGEHAARILGAVEHLRDAIGTPRLPTEIAALEPVLVSLRQVLDGDAFAAAWGAGRALSQQAVIAEAIAFQPSPISPPPIADSPQVRLPSLTAREREVLSALAVGDSNREIAGRLYLSERTVERHVANLCAKLGVDSRAKAATYAHQQGID